MTKNRLITAVLGTIVPKPHWRDQGKDQTRVIQMTGGMTRARSCICTSS